MSRSVMRCLVMLFLFSCCPTGVFAAVVDGDYPPPWPAGDITVTVPFPEHSEGGALFSLIRDALAAQTGMSATARHIPGRAGADAWARIIDDETNGSVLTLVLFPDIYLRSTQPDSGIVPDGIAVCNIIAFMPCVLWTAGPNAFATLQDVVSSAAGKAGTFLVAGSGRYSATQLASRALDRETGVRTIYVPYTGTVTAAKAVLDFQAEVFWGYSVPVSAPDLRDKALKPLVVAAEERMPSLPDVPTFQELGMRITQGVYIGLAVPLETPEITRQEISEFFSALAKTPDFQTKLTERGITPVDIDMQTVPVFLTGMRDDAERQAESFSLNEQ